MVAKLSGFAGELEVEAMLAALVVTAVIPDCGGRTPDGCGLVSGCVACIFTVALGSAVAPLFADSLGRLMRAVSFLGEVGLAMAPGAGGCMTPDGGAGGAGRSGTVGLPENGGGFGGGVAPLSGRESGGGAGGADGRASGGGGIAPELAIVTLEVSFFGLWIGGSVDESGTLTRTVSRLAMGSSDFGGKVIRMVSFLSSSSEGVFAEGSSSAMALVLE